MDPLLHYYRTLEETRDEKIAWMCFAADLPPAKKVIHEWIWHEGERPDVDGNIWKATLIHAIQDIIWRAAVRRFYHDINPWNYRGVELLWTRKALTWKEPDMKAIEMFLSAYGGLNQKSLEEISTLRFLYTSSEEEFREWMERRGASWRKIERNAKIVEENAESEKKLEKRLVALLF